MKTEQEIRDRLARLGDIPPSAGKTARLLWSAAADALEWALDEQQGMGLMDVLDEGIREEEKSAGRR